MKKSESTGFSLVEAMIVLVIIGMIMGTIYFMILHFRDVSGTEQARVRQTQELRFLFTAFASEVRNAGSIMSISRSYAASYGLINPREADGYMCFSGVFPLNNNTFPDGVILATADPNCVSMLEQPCTPSAGGSMQVDLSFNPKPQWKTGDSAILLGKDGYYICHVNGFDGNQTISMGTKAIYYSGLLSTTNYSDRAVEVKGIDGKSITYPAKTLVARVSSFSIYLMREVYDAKKRRFIRQLWRITDTKESADPFTPGADSEKSIIAENIWDMQIVYSDFSPLSGTKTTEYFTIEFSPNSNQLGDLLKMMDTKNTKEVTVNLVAMTDDYPGMGFLPDADRKIASFADEPGYTLPRGKYNFRQFAITILPKNFRVGVGQ